MTHQSINRGEDMLIVTGSDTRVTIFGTLGNLY